MVLLNWAEWEKGRNVGQTNKRKKTEKAPVFTGTRESDKVGTQQQQQQQPLAQPAAAKNSKAKVDEPAGSAAAASQLVSQLVS